MEKCSARHCMCRTSAVHYSVNNSVRHTSPPPKKHSIHSIHSILSIPSKGGWSFSRRYRTCLATLSTYSNGKNQNVLGDTMHFQPTVFFCKLTKILYFFIFSTCNNRYYSLYYINVHDASPSSRGLGQRVLIPPTPVRIRVEMPILKLFSTGIKVPVFLFKDFGL